MIQRAILASNEEEYAPPDREIEIAVVDDSVFITVYRMNDIGGMKMEYEVPVLDVEDLCAALWMTTGSDRNWGRPAS